MFFDSEQAQGYCKAARLREANLNSSRLSKGQVRQLLRDQMVSFEPPNNDLRGTCQYLFDNLSNLKSIEQVREFVCGSLEDLLIETAATFQRASVTPSQSDPQHAYFGALLNGVSSYP